MINGEYVCRRAWFKDNQNAYKLTSKDKNFNWKQVDNDQYISIYRQLDCLNIKMDKVLEHRVQRNLITQGTKLYFSTIKKQNYYSDKSKYGIQSFSITGDVSDLIQQEYNSMTLNEYTSLKRNIYLKHKNVINTSVILYYFDQFGNKKFINDFKVKSSNAYYNAYIQLSQNNSYLDKQVYIEYKYLIKDLIKERKLKNGRRDKQRFYQ